ncbi:hypothetical protein H0266_08310 [Halobacillus locisalis]|uniref:Uncharacterized protein n=1 Tax=Halobacillus locisalis TaxID=220753 RepID=A0A838CSQ4_9BACI|nr:hypothetical protein [Halobacillus locisalis]MBA2174893.1 hypothetical protein [Halobacillus locisalis]
MKRLFVIALLLITFSMALTNFFLNKADHHGQISKLGKDNFSLLPLYIDPEAEYNPPQIHFDDETNVSGEISTVCNLKNGQEVKVWLRDDESAPLADKIKVVNEDRK